MNAFAYSYYEITLYNYNFSGRVLGAFLQIHLVFPRFAKASQLGDVLWGTELLSACTNIGGGNGCDR